MNYKIKKLKLQIKGLESENQKLIEMLFSEIANEIMTIREKKQKTEYFVFTNQAKQLLHSTDTNCPPFTIRRKRGDVVLTSNGDTFNIDWLECINCNNPTYNPAPINCSCYGCKKHNSI